MPRSVVIFNPRSADAKHRIPNSIIQVAGSIHGKYNYHLVDGNLEVSPLEKILDIIKENEVSCVGMTVMPGPQLKQAIPFSKEIKNRFPEIAIVWGGYFASNQHEVVLNSGWVDLVVNGPGDEAFPRLLEFVPELNREDLKDIPNLIYLDDSGKIHKTRKEALPDMDNMPPFPYTVSYTHLTLPTTSRV